MPPTHDHWTVDMLDALPDDGQRYEIIPQTSVKAIGRATGYSRTSSLSRS